jgi:outer membrane protein OmpA-like peptidoglycan-associated protein
MEPRFGHDFSRVRVHTGTEAAQAAAALNARAYTVGPAIVFGAGEYAPATAAGRQLLAHELAHTIQQGERPAGAPGGLAVGPADDAYERAAEAAAERVVAPDARGAAPMPALSAGQARIQRQPAKTGDAPAPVVIPGSMPAIFFQFDTAEIRHDAEVDSMIHFVHVLTQIQAHMKKHGAAARIILHGFASMDGEKAHNLALSQKRADRIKELLVEAGIPEAQITAIGHGGDSTFPGLALNRRVSTELEP